jgi:hypothetical protein
MANLSFTGFHPWMDVGSTCVQVVRRRVVSNNGTAIFMGDCMKRTAAGIWGLATAGAGFTGVAQGASFFDSTINGRRENPFLPASTTYSATTFDIFGETDESFVYITADPINVRFQCQYSGSTPALADLTLNANILASAGSTVTGISGHTLNQATLAVTAALDVTVVDVKHQVTNDTTATSAKAIVAINQGVFPPFSSTNPGTSGV